MGVRAGRPLPPRPPLLPRPWSRSRGTAGRSFRAWVSALAGRAGISGGWKSLLVLRRGNRARVLVGRGGRDGQSPPAERGGAGGTGHGEVGV